jgi:hypothetical protein
MIKRYEPFLEHEPYSGDFPSMQPSVAGEWVKWEDYEAMKTQRDALLEWKDGFLSEMARS